MAHTHVLLLPKHVRAHAHAKMAGVRRRIEAAARLAREHASQALMRELEQEELKGKGTSAGAGKGDGGGAASAAANGGECVGWRYWR